VSHVVVAADCAPSVCLLMLLVLRLLRLPQLLLLLLWLLLQLLLLLLSMVLLSVEVVIAHSVNCCVVIGVLMIRVC